MASTRDIERRRKIRAMEAKRDALIQRMARDRIALASVRAEMKAMRSRRNS